MIVTCFMQTLWVADFIPVSITFHRLNRSQEIDSVYSLSIIGTTSYLKILSPNTKPVSLPFRISVFFCFFWFNTIKQKWYISAKMETRLGKINIVISVILSHRNVVILYRIYSFKITSTTSW